MVSTQPKPAGCIIDEIDDVDGRTYCWKKPGAWPYRSLIAAFLIFWLWHWALGWVAVVTELMPGKANGAELFLFVWLGGWTVGGMFAIAALCLLLRPPRPESVTLGFKSLQYDSGSPTMRFFNPWYAMRHYPTQWPFSEMYGRGKRFEIRKSDLGPVVLERIGERQQLCFDDGPDRIEIGEDLSEPEREWLAAIIEAWKSTP